MHEMLTVRFTSNASPPKYPFIEASWSLMAVTQAFIRVSWGVLVGLRAKGLGFTRPKTLNPKPAPRSNPPRKGLAAQLWCRRPGGDVSITALIGPLRNPKRNPNLENFARFES